jgi:8-oxo-dGTP diphosphatase
MSYRAAIILIENGRVALIERQRQGLHYFTFPGGHVEEGENPEHAAVRETLEELGLQVKVNRMVAKIWWQGQPQHYYLVERIGGEFGSGAGEEMRGNDPVSGSYKPVWVQLEKLPDLPFKPLLMAVMLVKAQTLGWPEPAPEILEEG